MDSKPRVFISYGVDTKSKAEELTQALESQGIETWVDFRDLQPGQRLRDEVERAIDSARWVLLLVGSANRSTPWQETEWTAALAQSWADHEKRLVPVVFGDVESPPSLRGWVPLRIDAENEPGTWTRHVVDALRSSDAGSYRGLDPKSRRERKQRLDEIGRLMEQLPEDSDEWPVNGGLRSQ